MLFTLFVTALALTQAAPRTVPAWVPDNETRWVQIWLSPTAERVDLAWLRSASAPELAARLLPASVADTVVEHQIVDDTSSGAPRLVMFHTDVASVGPDACRRASYAVALRPAASPSTVRGASINSGLELALAPSCHGDPDWRMARVSTREAAGALETLRWLRDARRTAAGDAPLPFEIHCRSPQPDACAPGARAVLAQLPLHQVHEVTSFQRQWDVLVTPQRPSDLHWRVRILRPAGQPARIDMEWTWPPPF